MEYELNISKLTNCSFLQMKNFGQNWYSSWISTIFMSGKPLFMFSKLFLPILLCLSTQKNVNLDMNIINLLRLWLRLGNYRFLCLGEEVHPKILLLTLQILNAYML